MQLSLDFWSVILQNAFMSEPAPDLDAPETPDVAMLVAERQLRLLQELSEIGMDLARALRDKAVADAATPGGETGAEAAKPTVKPIDPAAAFAGLSRAIRLTLMLETRAAEALKAIRAGVAIEVQARRASTARQAEAAVEQRRDAHRQRVERLVRNVADREIDDIDELEDLHEALAERLDDDPAYRDLDRLPLRETVERLCADLQITPDWSRWVGDDWIPEEPFYRFKCSGYWPPSRKPSTADNDPGPSAPDTGSYRLE